MIPVHSSARIGTYGDSCFREETSLSRFRESFTLQKMSLTASIREDPRLAALTESVTSFCFAVSDYTGFATFNEYNTGISSSLSTVAKGTSHGEFPIVSKRTVLVLEAMLLFSAIHEKQTTIHRLKMDMQGHELGAFRNIQGPLRDTNLVTHIKAECFCANENGKQIYNVDNSCDKISKV